MPRIGNRIAMAVSLPRTETALQECRSHLQSVAEAAPHVDVSAVGAYLAGHVAVLLCGEVEETLAGFFGELIDARDCDESVKALARSRKGVTRSAKVSDIAGAIGRLGDEAKDRFRAAVDATVGDQGISQLGNVVTMRDDTAHNAPPLVTFHEVELAAVAARGVLQAARAAMALP
jgi:hypothetical protein